MPARSLANQIAFRYRSADSVTGITRETAKRLAEQLGVDETQAIHWALRDLAVKLLPQYEADGEHRFSVRRQIATQFRAFPQSRASSYTSGIQASRLENTTTIRSLL